MKKILAPVPALLLLLTACGGGGKPETSVQSPARNPGQSEEPPAAALQPGRGPDRIPSAGPAGEYRPDCTARLENLRDKDDPAERAAIYVEAITPPPSAAEAACLLAAADQSLRHESDRLARAAAALLIASLSTSPQDRQFFIDSQPKTAQEYRPFGLRPDVYEVMQDKLLSLASAGSGPALDRLLMSLYFRDARIQDRLLPSLAALANQQSALFFRSLQGLDASGAGFILAAMKNRDLAGFRSYLRGRSGADAESAKQFLARLGAPAP